MMLHSICHYSSRTMQHTTCKFQRRPNRLHSVHFVAVRFMRQQRLCNIVFPSLDCLHEQRQAILLYMQTLGLTISERCMSELALVRQHVCMPEPKLPKQASMHETTSIPTQTTHTTSTPTATRNQQNGAHEWGDCHGDGPVRAVCASPYMG